MLHLIPFISAAFLQVPDEPITTSSLEVASYEESFQNWGSEAHSESYHLLQKVARAWEKNGLNQYLVFGKVSPEKTFSWEIIPHSSCRTRIGRFWQQFWVLWGVTVSRTTHSHDQRKALEIFCQELPEQEAASSEEGEGKDPFCQQAVIDRQLVYAGEHINVLYNYAPVGFQGERMHFLFVPRVHRENFSALTEEEYIEASLLAQKVVKELSKTRDIKEAYLFHKTGVDAGQTVPHWHLHAILTTYVAENFFGTLTVLRNMTFGSRPLKSEALQERVKKYQEEIFPNLCNI